MVCLSRGGQDVHSDPMGRDCTSRHRLNSQVQTLLFMIEVLGQHLELKDLEAATQFFFWKKHLFLHKMSRYYLCWFLCSPEGFRYKSESRWDPQPTQTSHHP